MGTSARRDRAKPPASASRTKTDVAFAGASLGYLIACLSPDSEFATVVAPLFVFPMILLGGLYANIGAIPVCARWINKVNPINYGFQAVSQAQWFSAVSEP